MDISVFFFKKKSENLLQNHFFCTFFDHIPGKFGSHLFLNFVLFCFLLNDNRRVVVEFNMHILLVVLVFASIQRF